MSGQKPGDQRDPAAVEATLDDLAPVESNPSLRPVAPTITLDEEVRAEPSATQLLDPVEDGPTKKRAAPRPTCGHTLDVSADAPSPQARRRAALKSDAFESFPSLQPAPAPEAPRGPPPAWKPAAVWTPGLVAMLALSVALLLVALVLLLRS